jgi:hypothetical protein
MTSCAAVRGTTRSSLASDSTRPGVRVVTDYLLDTECGFSRLDGGGGNDTIESYIDSYYGSQCSELEPTPYSVLSDRVIGGTGTDSATVDRYDTVSGVEAVTRK